MQYHHRSRLPPPPPPPPFGRGGGAVYPRGHRQLYAPPPPRPPLPAPPPPPQRRYEVLMEAGRLAAEYLVSTGVLPPSSLHRGSGDAWTVPPPPPPMSIPPPPLQKQQEPPAFYGRRRYEDVYSNNNPGSRPRRNSNTSSSGSRDDYSNGGSYNGRGKRKYGEYRRGYSDWGRDREKERGRSSSNGRRHEEDDDEDGAPGFRRDQRGSGGNDEARSCVTEEIREATPLMVKDVVDMEMEDIRSNTVSSSDDVRKDADALSAVHTENEEGEMKENKVSSSESEVVEQGVDTNGDVSKVMEAETKLLLDGKVVDEKAEDNGKVLCETSLDRITLDDDATNLENGLHVDRRNLLQHCGFAKAPTRPRSVRAHRNIVTETANRVFSGEASQMAVNEVGEEKLLTNIQSDSREDEFHQENNGSSAACNETVAPMPLQENRTSDVTENMREGKNNAQLRLVQQHKEETDVSSLTTAQKDSFMQENDMSPLTASRKDVMIQETNLSMLTDTHEDSLIEETNLSPKIKFQSHSLIEETNLSPLIDVTDQHKDSFIKETDLSPKIKFQSHSLIEETNLSPLIDVTDQHKDSFIKETDLSPLTASHKVSLMQETALPPIMSSDERNLNLQFKEGSQICDIEILPQDADLIELSHQRDIAGAELLSIVEAEDIIKMEEEKLDQSRSFEIHNNPGLGQSSAQVSSADPHKLLQGDFGASKLEEMNPELCQASLDSKAVQVIGIEDETNIEVAGFDSSKAKNEMICSSMDDLLHPGIHTDELPVIQDGYNFTLSDYLGDDIPCYTSMQPDLQAGICSNDSEGIPSMDDSIYGSLTDIGFMDVWDQPAEDFAKFF